MIELGYNDLAADLLVASLQSERRFQQAALPFELTYGSKLLPRLCYLTSAAGYWSGQTPPTLVPVQVISSTNAGFNQFRDLMFNQKNDEDVRHGALSLLGPLLQVQEPSENAESPEEQQVVGLHKERMDILKPQLENLAKNGGERERQQAVEVLKHYLKIEIYRESEEQFLRTTLADEQKSSRMTKVTRS